MKYFNKEELIKSSYMVNEDKEKLIKAIDILENGMKYYQIRYTNFLSPSVYEIIKDYYIPDDFKVEFLGGINKSERKIASIRPFYEDIDIKDLPIIAIEIEYSEKFSNITHRDVLGSLMSLGIKRETIGDIYIHDSFCHIIILKSIYEFLRINLKRLRKVNVKIKEISLKDIKFDEPDFNLIKTTISTNRLDTIIAKGFAIDRKTSKRKVNNMKVKVNHKVVDKPHESIKEEDLISVKGLGRIILFKINGLSRKDRLRIIIKKII